MREEDNFNPVEPVTPVTPTETPIDEAPMATPTEAVTPVEPTPVVETPVEPTPVVEPAVQTIPVDHKKKSVFPIIFVILVLALGGGAAYYFLVLNKDNKAGNEETTTTVTTEETTTTTAKKDVALLEFKTMDDYITYATDNQAKLTDLYLIAMDNNFFKVDYAVEEKCKNDGDKISFEENGLKIDYTCVKPTDIEVHGGHEEWETTVTVNSKYKLDINTASTCTNWHYFSNGKYFIRITAGCGMDIPIKMELESENNEKIYVGEIISNYVKTPNASDYKKSDMVSKDNVLYFVTQESVMPEKVFESSDTTCALKYIDLNSDKPEVKDTGVSAQCRDITEYKID